MSLRDCDERGGHAVGFGLAYGTHQGVQYVKCLDCGEELRLDWNRDDVAAFLRTSPIPDSEEPTHEH